MQGGIAPSLGIVYKTQMDYAKFMASVEKRREKIRDLRAKGWTYKRIGKKHNISWQRAQQLSGPRNGK